MSFSADVKNELARVTGEQGCCHTAELASLLRMGGTLIIRGNHNVGINFTSENAAVARKVLTLLKNGFQLKTEVVVKRARRLKKNNSYQVIVVPSAQVAGPLTQLGLMQTNKDDDNSSKLILRKNCCRRAYLRGAFLGGGSVNKPAGDYHLELVSSNYAFAASLLKVMKAFALPAKLTERKKDFVVYLKDGDAITSFLRIIGAHNALLLFENVRVVKEMRNQVNRIVNCETANLQKTVNAAVRQVEAIRLIERTEGIASLPLVLQETAELRLLYPQATLQELVDHDGGKISKSGINHRLRKLVEIAESIEDQGEK